MTTKYYFCETEDPNGSVTKSTPCDTPEDALELAETSNSPVHFISTLDPLSDEATF